MPEDEQEKLELAKRLMTLNVSLMAYSKQMEKEPIRT